MKSSKGKIRRSFGLSLEFKIERSFLDEFEGAKRFEFDRLEIKRVKTGRSLDQVKPGVEFFSRHFVTYREKPIKF